MSECWHFWGPKSEYCGLGDNHLSPATVVVGKKGAITWMIGHLVTEVSDFLNYTRDATPGQMVLTKSHDECIYNQRTAPLNEGVV